MKVEVLKKDDLKMNLLVENVPLAYINTIRRVIVEEVPTMAIDEVEFFKNSSALYDEVLAHRLGLIPLTTDLKSYNLQEECSCKGAGCAKCQVKLTLKSKGPCTVYASDLKTTDPKIKPVYPKTIIVKLLNGQELEFEATAILGKGKEHMKWAPGLAYYKNLPEIVINEKKCDNCSLCVEKCPKKVLKIEHGKLIVDKEKLFECTLCNACEDVCDKGAIKVNAREKDFIFYLESWGQLQPKEIIKEAISTIEKKFTEFIKEIKK